MYKLKEMILMLCFILSGALCYAHGEARIENEKGEGIPIEVNEDLSKAMGLTCSTSPNPATTWVNVDFTLPSNADRATLIVSNALGIKVAEYELVGDTGQKVLDLRDLANGVYTCTLICGKYQCTNKLVITK